MIQYKKYINTILNSEMYAPPARENMPSTKLVPNLGMQFDLREGFPILTGKKMPFYSILGELIGFMKGLTDVRQYAELGCNVWWDNAYNWNMKVRPSTESDITLKEYQNGVTDNGMAINSKFYDLGAIYSSQWTRKIIYTNYNGISGYYSQLENMIYGMIEKPFSRYHVLSTWRPEEMNFTFCSQPNCHVYFQTTCFRNDMIPVNKAFRNLFDKSTAKAFKNMFTEPIFFSSHLTQRSCDAFLGVPFNITSYSLLTIILAILTRRIPIEFSWFGVNNHIYGNHVAQSTEYYNRAIHELPKLHIEISKIDTLDKIRKLRTVEDLKSVMWLVDYKSGATIKAPLSVGM